MESDRIDIELSKIQNLRQYKNVSKEDLRHIAYLRTIEDQIDVETLFVSPEDKRDAKVLVKKYLQDYIPETVSDINTLRSILFLEILNNRFQQEINKAQTEGKEIPLRSVETIHKNLNEIVILKDALGLLHKEKEGSVKSLEQKILLMRKQFRIWMENNQLSRNAVCPYCGQFFLLRLKMEHWDAQKHPFIKDRILFNQPLTDLYLQKVITKDKLAEILETSPDYIDWMVDRMHKIDEKKEEPIETVSNDSTNNE